MDIAAAIDEIVTRLDAIPGLRAFGYSPGTVHPPVAIVTASAITYDETYGRGFDSATLGVTVVVGDVSRRSARDQLLAYTKGSGTSSVKAAVDGGSYANFDVARVVSADFDVVRIGGADYVAAVFSVDITGPGS